MIVGLRLLWLRKLSFVLSFQASRSVTPSHKVIWSNRIEDEVQSVFVETFGLKPEDVQLEVFAWEGSLWAKIQPKLTTFAFILSLYVGLHDASEYLKKDFQRVSKAVVQVVESVTEGQVTEVKEFPASTEYWRRTLDDYERVLGAYVPSKRKEEEEQTILGSAPPPDDEDRN